MLQKTIETTAEKLQAKYLDAKEISSMTGLCISEVEKFIEKRKH